FDIRQMSEMDRFHMAQRAANAVYGDKAKDFSDLMDQKLKQHKEYIREYGYDMPEVVEWKWENINK
ncbi:hypothetical protein DR081_03095, partial [Mycoplasma sp. MF12]|nr:hypothetical protein [Mycoplasma sp. MF12]